MWSLGTGVQTCARPSWVDVAGDVHEAARRGASGVHVAGVAVIAAAAVVPVVALRALVAMISMVPLRALVSLVAAFNRRGIVSPGARTVAFIAVDAAVAIAVVAVPVRPVVARTVAAGSLRLALVPRQVSLVGEALSVIDWPN